LFFSQPIRPASIPPASITPAIRSKYLQQFHSLVDVTKTNGFMSGTQAKNILQQTNLSQTLLHQIWLIKIWFFFQSLKILVFFLSGL
jgi:hypothetical protein